MVAQCEWTAGCARSAIQTPLTRPSAVRGGDQAGDTVLGYDFTSAVFNEAETKEWPRLQLPDVLVVKKVYPEKRRRNRLWKLRSLIKEEEEGTYKSLHKASEAVRSRAPPAASVSERERLQSISSRCGAQEVAQAPTQHPARPLAMLPRRPAVFPPWNRFIQLGWGETACNDGVFAAARG